MSDYIERDEVLRRIKARCCLGALEKMILYDAIMEIPVKDVAPVVHGHFVHDGPRFAGGVDWWHCSNCGRLASGVETRLDYCPWCGAKMDGRRAD